MESVKECIIEDIQREYMIPDDTDMINLSFAEKYVELQGLVQFIYTIEDEYSISISDDDWKTRTSKSWAK